MSETSTETPAADGEGERIHSLDDMSAKIDQLMEWAKGGGKKAEPEQPADVASEVQRELQKLKAAEDRKAARDKEKSELDAKLAALEDKVKEKPPREYRKVENWHKWRLDEEK